MFNRILVPTDFSAGSDAALEYARSLAGRFGGSLHLLHVVEDPAIMGAFGADAFATDATALREALLADAGARISRCLPPGYSDRCSVTTAVVIGTTAHTIVEYAIARGVDLIVMGTHGRSGIAHLLLGSVAEHVVRTAACPVLTVREARVKDEVEVPARAGRAAAAA